MQQLENPEALFIVMANSEKETKPCGMRRNVETLKTLINRENVYVVNGKKTKRENHEKLQTLILCHPFHGPPLPNWPRLVCKGRRDDRGKEAEEEQEERGRQEDEGGGLLCRVGEGFD